MKHSARILRRQWRFDPQAHIEDRVEFDPFGGCWLWTLTLTNSGYGLVQLGGRTLLAHRVSWGVFRGAIPVGADVLHRCDVRPCCNPDHLFLGDDIINAADRVAKGRSADLRGSRNSQAVLNEDAVAEIRRQVASGRMQKLIAADFGVTPQTICDIKMWRSWT